MTRRLLVVLCLMTLVQTQAQAQSTDATLFRQIFSAVVQPSSTDQLNHLIYAPTANLLNEKSYFDNRCQLQDNSHDPKETVARAELCRMTEAFKNLDARTLYNQGERQTSETASALNIDQLKGNLASRDLLIVVVPGIFGEFIQKRAFEEIFEKDSAFQRQWKSAYAAKSAGIECTAGGNSPVCDDQEKLQRLNLDPNNRGEAQIPMSDLLNVGSIDGADGKPLVRVILFQMDGMTLESLSTQQKNAEVFNRRMEKFFQILGYTPKEIAFVGYSRGTDFALEMLAQAKTANKPWLPNVKALVSLGGVVFGSALADDAVTNKSSKLNRQLQLADLIKRFLTPLPDTNKSLCEGANLMWLGKNMLGWYKIANAFMELEQDKAPATPEANQIDKLIRFIMQTSENRGGADPEFAIRLLTAELMKFGLFSEQDVQARLGELTGALRSLALNDFTPMIKLIQSNDPCRNHSVPNVAVVKYNTDIRRFKKLITAAVQGVTELSTDNRLQWWRTHAIPLSVRYYSVSGTMADPTTDLGNNRWTLNPGSPDDVGLIQNWRDFQKVDISPEYAGVNLNDSQMAVYKTMFWPKMIASLNPVNEGVRFTPLAIVGTHHWGLALPIVSQVLKFGSENGGGLMTVNPFPRAQLMEAIALSITNDLSVDAQTAKQGE